ncbi:unnamed protein product [Trichobilharzia regenti]|nr:unnamed protein product [Trichobilharzia regenti]
MVGFLLVLQALHIYWFCLIVKVALQVKTQGCCKTKINNDSSSSNNNINDNNNSDNNNINDDTNNKEFKSSVIIPYEEGTSETLSRILNKAEIKVAGIQTHELN